MALPYEVTAEQIKRANDHGINLSQAPKSKDYSQTETHQLHNIVSMARSATSVDAALAELDRRKAKAEAKAKAKT
jgi:hypothetical protein